jgi:hypothetical protein
MEFDCDVLSIVREIADFNKTHGITVESPLAKKESPRFSYVAAFFEGVVDAVKMLPVGIQLRRGQYKACSSALADGQQTG